MNPFTLETPLKTRFYKYAQLVTDGTYVVDNENIDQLRLIIQILEEGNKGIVICGKPGSGKTFIFEVLSKILYPNFHPKKLSIKTCDELVSDYEKIGDDALKVIKPYHVCYDELGREKNTAKYFGSDCDVMQKIIVNRYNLYKYKGNITHFTSNYSKADLLERYGMHCFSRLNEMNIFINLGTSESYTDRRLESKKFIHGLPDVLPYYKTPPDFYKEDQLAAGLKNIKDIISKL